MVPNSLRSLFAHISVVSSKGMLVNRESTPKIKLLIKILSPKWQESFAVNSPVVTGLKIGTKNFGVARNCPYLGHVPYVDYM